MQRLTYFIFILLFILFENIHGQDFKSKGTFKEIKKGFYHDSILTSISEFESQQVEIKERKQFVVDFSDESFPVNINKYKQFWHHPPLSQGATGTCWCFSAISFFESEVYRTTGQEVKLSEMYFVYFEYVERAKDFVQTRGATYFAQGSEANAIPKLMKTYGALPASAYVGKLNGQQYHNHSKMVAEMKAFLQSVKDQNLWNEEYVISTIKNILNHYMGAPPALVLIDGNKTTPQEYLSEKLQIDPQDYFSFMSTKSQNYNEQGELVEPDNWWHGDNYYNVQLDDFLEIFKDAIKEGYTLSFCGDVSEPGYDRYTEVGIIPAFDIPSEYINEDARELRLVNQSTTDDHCMHIVGYQETKSGWWFLVKDSSASAFDGPNKGYRFLHEDYIKLKMMNVLVYKYAAKEVLDQIIK